MDQQHLENTGSNLNKKEPLRWYVFYVKSRTEKKANVRLAEEGFKTYLPIEKVLRQYSDRKKWIEKPLFNGYIFIKIKRHEIYNVLSNPYVVTFIRFQGEPATVPESQLLAIKRLLENKTNIELVEGELTIGKEIKLSSGPFRGMKGKIAEKRGKKKFVIEIKELNTNVVVNLDELSPPSSSL